MGVCLHDGPPGFILQRVVDRLATASHATKPISILFGLAGLRLRVERQFSGRRVEEVHLKLGRRKREWPHVGLPEAPGSMTVVDMLAAPPAAGRDIAIQCPPIAFLA
jgi:hypothetical protein